MRKENRSVLVYFYKLVWQEKPRYFFYMVSAILLTSGLPFITIIFPKYLIDELMGNKNLTVIIGLVAGIVITNFIMQSLLHICDRELLKLNEWFEGFFERKLSFRNMRMDFEHMENPETLNQSEKAREGMWFYSGGLQGLTTCFRSLLSSAITLFGVIVIIAAASPFLLIIALFAVIGGSFVVHQINKLEIAVFNKGPQFNRGFGYIFMELCYSRYGKDIRLYNAQEMLMKQGDEILGGIYRLFKEQHDGTQKWGCVNAVISVIKNIGIYLYLGYLAWIRRVTIGDFMMLVTAANSFKDCLQDIITQIQEFQKKTNFMGEYKKFMEYEDALVHGDKEVPDMEHPCIEFCNVSFCYPRTEHYVLKDVSLRIEPGEHLSIVGLNGAGKTTFIKLLCRLYDVTEGEIKINGVNIQEYAYEEYMKLLSVVFQDFKLFAMSMEENIRLGNWERETTDLMELCEICGLKEKIDSLPGGLQTKVYKHFDKSGIEPSGGEAQKMAIARALYKGAPVVILDEPTAALDPVAEYEIYNQFDKLVGGKTAVYISHRLSSCKFCDRIAVFAKNTVAEYGTHEELVRKAGGIYAEMFEAQAQYYV